MNPHEQVKILAEDYSLLLIERDLLLKKYCKETKKRRGRVLSKIQVEAHQVYRGILMSKGRRP